MIPPRLYRELRLALTDVFAPAAVPGYAQLNWADRRRADWRALCLVLRAPGFPRVLAAYSGWLLLGKTLVWRADVVSLAQYLPELTALVWLLPLAARARRNALRRVAGPHWSRL